MSSQMEIPFRGDRSDRQSQLHAIQTTFAEFWRCLGQVSLSLGRLSRLLPSSPLLRSLIRFKDLAPLLFEAVKKAEQIRENGMSHMISIVEYVFLFFWPSCNGWFGAY